jgi:hypothetical protein
MQAISLGFLNPFLKTALSRRVREPWKRFMILAELERGGLVCQGKLVEVRKNAGNALFRWAERRGVRLHQDLKQVIAAGFPKGDDAFDAVIGLFGMLEVVLGHRATGELIDELIDKAVSDIEGWILGQTANPTVARFQHSSRS